MYLLDSNVLLWYLQNNPQLNPKIFDLIDDQRPECRYSIASLWEIALKIRKGKLRLPEPIFDILPLLNMRELPLEQRDLACMLAAPPGDVTDPFDQILMAQAQMRALILVTSDESILRAPRPGLARMDSRA